MLSISYDLKSILSIVTNYTLQIAANTQGRGEREERRELSECVTAVNPQVCTGDVA